MSDWIIRAIEQMGYLGIALLMFLENLFPPIPSELIMPFAGFTASRGDLVIAGVILAGLCGTLMGACFWYGLARRLGEGGLRRWADRHGRWLTLSASDIDGLERWFERHGGWAVPVAHIVPGLRTLISIPAGTFRMHFGRFLLWSAIGAGAWTSLLGVGGYLLEKHFDRIDRYLGPVGTGIMALLLIYYLYRVATFGKRS